MMPSDQEPRLPDRPIHLPMGGPPATDKIPVAVFEAMGEDNIMGFTRAFYVRIGESPLAPLFPKGEALMQSSEKSGAMFIFLFGGPHRYQQIYGPPRMRMRHFPFQIGPTARDEWLVCLRATLAEASEKFQMPAEHVGAVDDFFDAFSMWMVNAEDDVF